MEKNTIERIVVDSLLRLDKRIVIPIRINPYKTGQDVMRILQSHPEIFYVIDFKLVPSKTTTLIIWETLNSNLVFPDSRTCVLCNRPWQLLYEALCSAPPLADNGVGQGDFPSTCRGLWLPSSVTRRRPGSPFISILFAPHAGPFPGKWWKTSPLCKQVRYLMESRSTLRKYLVKN